MLLPLQGATAPTRGDPGCRYACPGLWATLAFQAALARPERLFIRDGNIIPTIHSLAVYYDIADLYLRVRLERPMQPIAQGKRSDTLGLPVLEQSRPVRAKALQCALKFLPDSNNYETLLIWGHPTLNL